MGCYNQNREKVYYSIDEIMEDPTLTEDERQYIMTKSKTTVQVDATHQKTVWTRSNSQESNRYRRSANNSRNTTNNNYNNK